MIRTSTLTQLFGATAALSAIELTVIARAPALVMAMAAYVAVCAGFIVFWPDGVPSTGADNLYAQARLVQWGWLAVCLPWVAARCQTAERGDRFVMTSVLTALRPSTILAARTIASCIALTVFTLTGLPVAIAAQQIAAVPPAWVARDTVALLGLPVLVAAVTLAWTFLVRGRLGSWLGATASVAAVVGPCWRWLPAGLGAGSVCALVGLIVAAVLARWGDRSLVYLSERRP